MKVSELTGAMLDYWVARAEGIPADALCFVGGNNPAWWEACSIAGDGMFRPSTKWGQGGPIFEREGISGGPAGKSSDGVDNWVCQCYRKDSAGNSIPYPYGGSGPTLLTAAMRAYVASKFGETVPDNEQ